MALWPCGMCTLRNRLRLWLNTPINQASTTSSSRSPTATVFIEIPIITVTDSKNVDLIGPPHSVSNLRPIVRRRHVNETKVQEMLRKLQDDTQAWNQSFWLEHNSRFIQQRKEFVRKRQLEKGSTETLSAEEMSEFYKQFLDDNWKSHSQYNVEWYKRNFQILLFSICAALPSSLHFIANVNDVRN